MHGFHTRKLGETTVFYALNVILSVSSGNSSNQLQSLNAVILQISHNQARATVFTKSTVMIVFLHTSSSWPV